MENGNSNPNTMALQQIATQCNQTNQMVNQIGKMANEQRNILNKLIGASTHLNCLLVAQLASMDEYARSEVMKEYEELCKKCGINPLVKIQEEEGE